MFTIGRKDRFFIKVRAILARTGELLGDFVYFFARYNIRPVTFFHLFGEFFPEFFFVYPD